MRCDALHHLRSRGLILLLLAIASTPAFGATSVSLAWDANTETDIAGYVIWYGTQAGTYTTRVDVGKQTSWSTNGLQGGKRYYFAVQAYNSSMLYSSYSEEISAVAAYPDPPPTVSGVSPASGSANGGTALVITGANFRAGATAVIGNKAALSTVVVSATTINAVAPPGVAGAADVRVINIDGQTAALAGAYTYVSNVITITSVLPVSGLSRGGTALMIKGTNFGTGASVFVGGIVATNVRVVGSTLIAATAPAHSAGLVDVRVTLADGRNGTLDDAFTYVNGKPTTSLVSPKKGSIRGGTTITITGGNFVSGATVTIGGAPAPDVTVVSANTITAVTPMDAVSAAAAMTAAATTPRVVEVTVRNPDGQTGTLSAGFTYDILAPTVTSVSPASGPVNGGTKVTIRGTELAEGAVVMFGAATATEVVRLSSTSLTAVTPAHMSGTVDVLVRNPDGLQGVRQRLFTYVGSNTTLDSDKDGMPDVYEDQVGLDPNLSTGDDGASGDPDGDGRPNLAEYNAGTHPRGFVKRYFAEGVSSTFFTTVFALANPGDEEAHVVMLFMRGDGSVYSYPVTVPPTARKTINTRTIPGVATVAFSTTIESDKLFIADRTMSWDASGYGAHAETAIEKPSTVWYLAEGATHSGFDLFYLVQNPTADTAQIQVQYLLPDGDPIVKAYTISPYSRYNIWVDLEHPRLAQTDVSAVVNALNGVPVIVERSMYMNAGGRAFGAGHNSAGVTAPATKWFLAEGATGDFFDEFILLANPEPVPAQVLASYMLPNGTTVKRSYTLPPTSRYNIWLDLEDQQLAAAAVSAQVESTNGVPIIVERTMWWPGPTAKQWAESHNSPGATVTSTKWALAEGEQGGTQKRATFILLANTSPYEGLARVTLLFENGKTASRTFPLLPGSRFNVAVGDEFPEAANRRFGAVIESIGDTPAELVVERAMYWNAGNQYWAAGSNALATPLP